MRRHGQQIDIQAVHVERHDAHALRRVGVKTHTALAGDPADLSDRRQRPDLVVAMHDGDKYRLRSDRAAHGVGIHAAVPVHRKHRDLDAVSGQPPARFEDGMVLGGRGDDVPAGHVTRIDRAEDRGVI